jgi:hypothetical protein
MRNLPPLLLLLLLLGGPTPAQSQEHIINEGGQTNVFLDDDKAQVHLLLRDGRLVFAFPAENSGMGVWFEGKLEIVPGSLRSLVGNGSNQVVEVKLRVAEPTTVGKVVLDSIRTLRDESEGVATAARLEKARGAGLVRRMETIQELSYTKAYFQRQQRHLPAQAGTFDLDIAPSALSPQGDLVLSPGTVTMTARLPFKRMRRFLPAELYSPAYLKDLERTAGRIDDSLRALEFLARHEKMMAGSWRFLTYFGRDTLISLAMLEPILSDEALTKGVESVLDRLSADGMVAHEEDIGPWAEWRHLQAGEPKGLQPVYDHKMVDDDLLLPVLLAKLRENGRGAVVDGLMKNPKRREAILRNAGYVLGLLSKEQLIGLNPGESTGDWRDSHEGLGGGVYPASVNADLALPALQALEMIYRSLEPAATEELAKVQLLRPVWEKLAAGYWMELSPDQVASRLDNFAKTLTAEQKIAFDNLVAARPDLLKTPFRFPVLSFNEDKSPVVVPHTDVAFTLFYGHPEEGQLASILTLLERPFPYGLSTPAGHLVASPVFSTNPEHYRSLGFGQYHGLVVWSWPSAMLQFGLLRQKERFPALDARLDALLAEIRSNENRVGALATSELWAIGLDRTGITWRAYGVAGDQAESNALQLWSAVYPALEFVRQKSPAK